MSWSARSSKYDQQATEARWKHYSSSPPSKIRADAVSTWRAKPRRGGTQPPTARLRSISGASSPRRNCRWDCCRRFIERWAFSSRRDDGLRSRAGLAVAALAACAAAIPDSIGLQVKKKFDEHWTREPRGCGLRLVGGPVQRRRARSSCAAAGAGHADGWRSWCASTRPRVARLRGACRRPSRPTRRSDVRLRIDDATIEAAAGHPAGQPRRAALPAGRALGLVRGDGQVRRQPWRAEGPWLLVCRAYNGGEYPVDRITRRSGPDRERFAQPPGRDPARRDPHAGGRRRGRRSAAADAVRPAQARIAKARMSQRRLWPANTAKLVEALNKLRPEPPSAFTALRADVCCASTQGAQAIREDSGAAPHRPDEPRDRQPEAGGAHRQVRWPVCPALPRLARGRELRTSNPLPPTIAGEHGTARRAVSCTVTCCRTRSPSTPACWGCRTTTTA